jgi:hypothetical protein
MKAGYIALQSVMNDLPGPNLGYIVGDGQSRISLNQPGAKTGRESGPWRLADLDFAARFAGPPRGPRRFSNSLGYPCSISRFLVALSVIIESLIPVVSPKLGTAAMAV